MIMFKILVVEDEKELNKIQEEIEKVEKENVNE